MVRCRLIVLSGALMQLGGICRFTLVTRNTLVRRASKATAPRPASIPIVLCLRSRRKDAQSPNVNTAESSAKRARFT
ncbi:hypothetical protein FKP32DRAFT_3822 [Trametes sanguinea]|nr:hypothetical protein FKP32DRAFT_3822 [Trametes sanguinea]